MSTITLTGIEARTLDPDSGRTGANAVPAFVACAVLLATIAYAMPINHTWFNSVDQNYGVDLADLESRAREGTWMRQLALATLGLFGLTAACWPGGRTMRINSPLGILCIAYVAWCAASCLWAADPQMSIRGFVGAMCEASAGFAIAKRASPRQFVWIVFACTFSWLGLGLLAELSLGTFRPWEMEHRFAGIFHPNDMGVVCALLVASSACLARGAKSGQWMLGIVAAAGLVFLYFTRSRTSLATMMVALCCIWFVTAPRGRMLVGLFAGAAVAALLAILIGSDVIDMTASTGMLGRESGEMSSLTGRVPLWEELLPYAAKRPWAGYGYNSFWTATHIVDLSGFEWGPICTGHSLYLDLMLNVGCVGAALCLSAVLWSLVRSIRRERQLPNVGYSMIAILLFYLLLSGISETTFQVTHFLSLFAACGVCFVAFRDEVSLQLTRTGDPTPQVAVQDTGL